MRHRPYLDQKRSGGGNYYVFAFGNYCLLVFLFYITSDFWGIFIPQPTSPTNLLSMASELDNQAVATERVEIVQGIGVDASTPTFYPTYTPYPTQTPLVDWLRGSPIPTGNSFHPSQVNFVFSYYWPPLVSRGVVDGVDYTVNCHVDNWLYSSTGKVNGCRDITGSGLPWSAWRYDHALDSAYRGGVAVPYYPDTYNLLYPYGSVFHVTEPPILAGDYLVVDACPGCNLYFQSHGVLFIDFVANGLPPGVNFWDKVVVSDVTYPFDVLPTFTASPIPTETVTMTPMPTFKVVTQIPDTPTVTVTATVTP